MNKFHDSINNALIECDELETSLILSHDEYILLDEDRRIARREHVMFDCFMFNKFSNSTMWSCNDTDYQLCWDNPRGFHSHNNGKLFLFHRYCTETEKVY